MHRTVTQRTVLSSVLSSADTYALDDDNQSYLNSASSVTVYSKQNSNFDGTLRSLQTQDLSARFKYFAAIKSGLPNSRGSGELAEDETSHLVSCDYGANYAETPTHVVDEDCFVFPLPLVLAEPGSKHNSHVIVFSIWNTMIGTAVVCLPWAFQQSGMVLATILCFSNYLVCFYTTKLIVDATGQDADFSITLRKYFGGIGYYTGIIAPAIVMLGAMSALYIILS